MSSLKFGTSGLRGLVTDLEGEPAQRWTAAFLRYMESTGKAGLKKLLIGRDLRSSSPRIAADCVAAAQACGWSAIDCGALPTPALALAALNRSAPAIMVTGSHIPDDRNGLKFYSASGEITKADEEGIRRAFEAGASLPLPVSTDAVAEDGAEEALARYRRRYTDFFASDALSGMIVGVYQQSSVARDLLVEILTDLGATTVPLGRSDRFIPIDTEAHRPEDLELLRKWASEMKLDAIVSTDGDADRPLLADSEGVVLRGDIVGLLAAADLNLSTIVTPVTSSAAIETSGMVRAVHRTKVGSPFVIEGIERALKAKANDVIGFEANGGLLLGSPVLRNGRTLEPLLTRDALLPIVCLLASAYGQRLSLRQLADRAGAGHALADRLKDISAERGAAFLKDLRDKDFAERFFEEIGDIARRDQIDGVRFLLTDGSVVHFRPSGNAPEFRCYVESRVRSRADQLLAWSLSKAKRSLEGYGVSGDR